MIAGVIANHLRSNRKLVVPNFGAFMVKESGDCVFSDLLRDDDGVLTSLLYEMGLNEMEAAITVDRFIFEARHELEQYGYYRVGDVGTLRLEPETKVLRLYPPVQAAQEEVAQTPYVPQPIEHEEEGESADEADSHPETNTETPIEKPEKVVPAKSVAKPRKELDAVMVVAIAIVAMALLAIGYGVYVSML